MEEGAVAGRKSYGNVKCEKIYPILETRKHVSELKTVAFQLNKEQAIDLAKTAALARHLAAHLAQEAAPGFNPAAANDADRYFTLSAPNLSLLYRHARLAKLLRLSIDDLFQLLGLLGLDRVAKLADLQALLERWTWWTQSGYRLDEIAIATGQTPRDVTRFPGPAIVASGLVALVAPQ